MYFFVTKHIKKIVMMAFGMCLGMILGFAILYNINGGKRRVYIEAQKINLDNETLKVSYNVKDYKDCFRQSQKYISTRYTQDGEEIKVSIPLGEPEFIFSSNSSNTVEIYYAVPKDVWPAKWEFYSDSTSCSEYIPDFLNTEIKEVSNQPVYLTNINERPRDVLIMGGVTTKSAYSR